jgi:hypothetical protein
LTAHNPWLLRDWREKQAAEIKARDQASEAKRRETIAKAERAIDQFYDEYAAKTKRNIRENKYVLILFRDLRSSDQECVISGITRRNSSLPCPRLCLPGQRGNEFAI